MKYTAVWDGVDKRLRKHIATTVATEAEWRWESCTWVRECHHREAMQSKKSFTQKFIPVLVWKSKNRASLLVYKLLAVSVILLPSKEFHMSKCFWGRGSPIRGCFFLFHLFSNIQPKMWNENVPPSFLWNPSTNQHPLQPIPNTLLRQTIIIVLHRRYSLLMTERRAQGETGHPGMTASQLPTYWKNILMYC